MKRRQHLRDDELFPFADSHLRQAFPNPQREDCPGDEELRRTAEAPAESSDILEHISTCSPCYIRYAELLEEQRKAANAGMFGRLAAYWQTKRGRIVWASAVAVVLLALAAVLLISRSRPQPTTRVAFAIDLSSASPSRGTGQERTGKQIRVPQELLDLTLELPVGSEEGQYAVSLRSGPNVIWSEILSAHFKDHVLTLKAQVDFRLVATGQYELTVESAGGARFVQPIQIVDSARSGARKSGWRDRLLATTASHFFSIRLPSRTRGRDGVVNASSTDINELLSAADHLAWLGNWSAAAPLYVRSELLATKSGDAKAVVHARIGRIRSQAESMEFAQASQMLEAELEDPLVQTDPRLRLFALTAKGYTDLDVNLASCRAAWEQALQVARELHDRQWESRAMGELGIVTFLEGDRKKAEKLVGSALLSAMENGDAAAQVRLFSMIGNGLADIQRYEEASEFFTRALKLAKETKDIGFSFMAYEGEARCLAALGRPKEAKQLLEAALGEAQKADKLGHKAQILTVLGEFSLSNNKVEEAEKYLKEAGDLSHVGQFRRIETEAMNELATIYRSQGKLDKTEQALRRGIAASRAVGDRYYLPRDLSSLAQIKVLRREYREADELFEQAADVLDGMLLNAPSWNTRSTMTAAASDIYLRHFALAVKQNDVQKAFQIVERARGRSVADLLLRHPSDLPLNPAADRKISSLQVQLIQSESKKRREQLLSALFEAEQRRSFVRSQTAKPYPVRRPVRLRVLQRSLQSNELLLEYVLSDPDSYCLAITRTSTRIVLLPASRGRLELLVRKFLSQIRDGSPADETAHELYTLLLDPIPAVQRKFRNIVVPDGILHLLPFDALQTQEGKYLLESSVTTYAPSATVLQLLRSGHRVSSALSFLGVGKVVYEPEAVKTAALWPASAARRRGFDSLAGAHFQPLPGSGNEVLAAAEAFGPHSIVLLGPEATEANFKREPLGKFRVLHLAVHGVADSKYPERAALVLGRDSKSGDDGLLQAREIVHLGLNADLVTLSACDTGVGKLEGEEGVASLQNAFLMAGARSTVATLWTADDTFTAALIKLFYKHLAAGMDKGSALRAAKLELIRKFGDKAKPFYWAAFVLAGDSTSAVFPRQ